MKLRSSNTFEIIIKPGLIALFIIAFQFVSVLSESSENSSPARIVILKLIYDYGDIILDDIQGMIGYTPDRRSQPKDGYRFESISESGEILECFRFKVPTVICIDGDSAAMIDREYFTFILTVPYDGASEVNIYKPTNKLALRIDMKMHENVIKEGMRDESESCNSCVTLIQNGDPEDKIDVVFVPDGYEDINELDLFEEYVFEHIDWNAEHNGIFSREPFKSNKYKYNFHYIREIRDFNCVNSHDCDATAVQLFAAEHCSHDEIIVLNKYDGTRGWAYLNGGFAVSRAYPYTVGSVWGAVVVSHEFGHSFGGLVDEYFRYKPESMTHGPNCDIATREAGCPKWCSGKPIPPEEYPDDWNCMGRNYEECLADNSVHCWWFDSPDPYFGTNCAPIQGDFNIGTNCLDGMGCYRNCRGCDGWRPSNDCIMGHGMANENPLFCPVCQRHLWDVFSRYNFPPVLSQIPDIAFSEDDSLVIHISSWYTYVFDPDDSVSSLSWSFLRIGDFWFEYYMVEKELHLWADPDWYGSGQLAIIVNDPFGLSSSIATTVTVTPINDAPMIHSFPDTSLESGYSLTLNLNEYVRDADNPDSTLQWQAESSNDSIIVIIDGVNNTAIITASAYMGTAEIVFTVTDDSLASDRDTMFVTVYPTTSLSEQADVGELPKDFRLFQNYPNPFNAETDIRYQIPDNRSPVLTTLMVFNILGREVKILLYEMQKPGNYTVTWDGKDRNGNDVVSGVYFYRLEAGDFVQTMRMLLLR